MLPFAPLTVAEHQNRWPAAIAKTWDFASQDRLVEATKSGQLPGRLPEHCFDFVDGMHLIASREAYDFGIHLHVSASAELASPLYRDIQLRRMTMEQFYQLVRDRVQQLGGPVVHLGQISPGKHVPHYYDPPLPWDRMDPMARLIALTEGVKQAVQQVIDS